ncbi:MAG: hypothetical protein E7Z92_04455 [Cyanobacteria bacterium SIG31]|nr:hypothetical protein [Cyanobacteria bacterium SIG31]
MKVTPITNPVDVQQTAFKGKVGKSVYKYYEAQREQIINFKHLQTRDIDAFKNIVPKTIDRLKSFMDKLHPNTTLEFKLKENNEVVPYFYNNKTNTSLYVPSASNHIPARETIYTGSLNLSMGSFSNYYIRNNIYTIDTFSEDLISLTSRPGNAPKDIDDALFKDMFITMREKIKPNSFWSDLKLKYNAKKLEKLAPEFDVVSQDYPKQLFDAKVDLEETSKKQLAEKQEKQKIIDDLKSFKIK